MNNAPYPCLWFVDGAKEAAEFYCKIFPNSKMVSSNPMATVFLLNDKSYMALNGAQKTSFNEGVSFVVTCEDQIEINHYWNAFTTDGEEGKCGWCKDKYGVSWQIVPAQLGKWMSDPKTAPKAMYSFMQMKKFDLAVIEKAVLSD